MSNLGLLVTNLDQGIAYYFRVAAINAVGRGPYALAATPFAVPLLRQPGMPIVPTLNVVDGTSLIVGFQPPALDGGSNINNYKIEYATSPFQSAVQSITGSSVVTQEQQTITITTDKVAEVQLVYLSTTNTGSNNNCLNPGS
jgi:hypothetical protein